MLTIFDSGFEICLSFSTAQVTPRPHYRLRGTALRFSHEEIEAAQRLSEHGLAWEPKVGDYLFDGSGFCQQPSPFQDRVYFILNYSYFMRIVGGVERFKEIMVWLPTWDDLRELLRQFHISDVDVAQYLSDHQAIESGCERLALYRLVESCLLNVSDRSTGP